MHFAITDSGLGGLMVCAGLDAALGGAARLTFVNAWPETGRGYNDLPDMAARAQVFDRVLDAMAALQPTAILIACNTLSIIHEHTTFRTRCAVPVRGIIDGGLRLFKEALEARPGSAIVLIGTRTTIESGVHRDGLAAAGIAPARIGGASCHGLATAIEQGPDSGKTAGLIAECAGRAAEAAPPGEPLLLGLACTHYGIVGERLTAALADRSGRLVLPLDPNTAMVNDVLDQLPGLVPNAHDRRPEGTARVEVISKVDLSGEQREGIARVLEPSSPATAAALRGYRHVPDLF